MSEPSGSPRWLVVGLGNPGQPYAAHRHTLGYRVVDLLAQRAGVRLAARRPQALTGEGRLDGAGVVLAKPTTYMNESGGPVAGLVQYFKVGLDHLVVVHDELDLPLGVVRLKAGGGEGGHNGLRSVTASLGSPAYVRVRLGIGRPPGRMDPADFVLRGFPSAQREEAELLVVDGADAVEAVLARGLAAAQLEIHSRS